jgi:DNA-binding IclR family transcriptional regulator
MNKIAEKNFLIMEKTTVKKGGLKTLDKALALLEFFSIKEKERGEEIGVSEINKTLHLGLSTIHRILTTFKARGYIIQNQKTMKYRLGIKLFELGYTVQNINRLIETIKPYLCQLSQSTGETGNLAILEGKEVVYIAKVESSEVLTTNIKVGARLPANCTALGKISLAFMPKKEFDNLYKDNKVLPSLTSNSITSLKELKKQLKKIREQGYAVDKEEYKAGVNCMAVPIKDKKGNAIAAISLTGPALRFTLEKIEKNSSNLMRISKEISKHI